jgi:hypothetical protein
MDPRIIPVHLRREIKVGERFGILTVIEPAGKAKSGHMQWKCLCDCGKETVALGHNIRKGNTTSCGCRWRKHGQSNGNGGRPTSTYKRWGGILDRCTNPNNKKYHLYGGRGITVCDRWRESFTAFLEDMGERPSKKHSLDRYPDQNGNYEPGNCRWATIREQNRNKSSNRLVTFQGETLTIAEWAERKGMIWETLDGRLKKWTVEKALTTPVRPTNCQGKTRAKRPYLIDPEMGG